MMDVQLVNDVSDFDSVLCERLSKQLTRHNDQGPVTLILDSTVDAPAGPTAKTPLSNDLKAKRKAELAAKAQAKSERIARETSEKEATSEKSTEQNREELIKEEDELVAEAERKSKELADRFKVAMTESY